MTHRSVIPSRPYESNADRPWDHLLFHELTHAFLGTTDSYAFPEAESAVYGIKQCCKVSNLINAALSVSFSSQDELENAINRQPIIADCITYSAMYAYHRIQGNPCQILESERKMDTQNNKNNYYGDIKMKLLTDNVTCSLNANMVGVDIIVTYNLVNSLPFSIALPDTAIMHGYVGEHVLTLI